MMPTFIGIVVVLLSLIFFLNDSALLALFVFFTPFTATSMVATPGSRFGIQPAYFIGALLVIKMIIKLLQGKLYLHQKQKSFLTLIIYFWVFALSTLLFPLILNHFKIEPIMINPLLTVPTRLMGIPGHALNSFIYFTFFMLVAIAVMFEVNTFEKLLKSLRVFFFSAFFTAVWALGVQYPSLIFKFPYPYWIFNNHPGYGQSWGGVFPGGALSWSLGGWIPRLASVSPESSMYGFFLVMVISLLFLLTVNKQYVFGEFAQKELLFLLFLVSWLSTSTTAYIGIALMLFGAFLFYSKPERLINLKFDRRQFTILSIIFSVVFLCFIAIWGMLWVFNLNLNQFVNIINALTFSKMSSGSGGERFSYFSRGIEILFETLFLGSGWGVNRTTDFISTMLANLGILGFSFYFFMILRPPLAALLYFDKHKAQLSKFGQISLALGFSFVLSMLLMIFSIPDFIFMYYWYLFGLLLALPAIMEASNANRD